MSQQPQGGGRLPSSVMAPSTGTHGSQTMLHTEPGPSQPAGTLRLRAQPDERRHIQWAEDVVDNEGMGRKSSKVCCIYHKPHEPGDSDSDSESDSSESDSDSEPDLSRAQRAGGPRRREGRDHGRQGDADGKGTGEGKDRKPSPNAYERQPRNRNRGK